MNAHARQRWIEFRDNPCETTFVPLYEATRRLVYTVCLRMLRDEDDALDAFQAVYCRLLEAARRRETGGDSPDDFQIAIGRLAVREADALRKRRDRRSRREIAMDPIPEPSASGPAPDTEAARHLLRAKLETLVETLPERHRVVLQLHYFHGLSKAQIAGMLEKPVSTVSRRIDAGLKRLRPLLQRIGIDDVGAALGGFAAAAILLHPPAKAAAAAALYQASAAMLAASGGTAATAAGATATTTAGSGTSSILSASAAKSGIASWTGAIAAGVVAAGVVVAVVWALSTRQPAPTPPPTPPPTAASISGTGTTSQPPATSLQRRAVSAASSADTETAASKPQSANPQAEKTKAPGHPLAIRLIWDDTKAPVTDTDVALIRVETKKNEQTGATSTLLYHPGTPGAEEVTGHTDARGETELLVPPDWTEGNLFALHPDSTKKPDRLMFPPESAPHVMIVERGATVYGHVWMENGGQPAAGATVEVIAATGESMILWGGRRQHAVVRPDGAYEITGLALDKVRLLARMGGLRSAPDPASCAQVNLIQGERVGPHDLVLRTGPSLVGRITDASTGKPVEGASVVLDPQYPKDSEKRKEAATDAEGRYRLEGLDADSFQVAALSSTHAETWIWVDIKPESPTECNFRLERGLPVEFEVVDPDGQPLPGVEFSRKIGGMFYKAHVFTGENGRARFDAVSPASPPEFQISKKGYIYNKEIIPTLDESRNAFKPVRIVMHTSTESTEPKVFIGTVTDLEGNPIAGATVQWAHEYDQNSQRGAETKANAEGHYRLEIPTRADGSVLSAYANGHAPAWREWAKPGTPDAPATINFSLDPGHWIAGRVIDADGKPLPNITLRPNHDTKEYNGHVQGQPANAKTGPDGKFRFENIPAPTVRLIAFGTGWSFLSKNTPVDQEVELVLHPIGIIRGRVIDADTEKPVTEYVLRAGGGGIEYSRAVLGRRVTDPNGEFTIKDVNVGQGYQITIEADGFEPTITQDVQPVVPDSDAPPVEIRVTRGEWVEALVVDSVSGNPVAGGEAFIALYREGYHFDWDQLNESNEALKNVRRIPIAPDGTFSFLEGPEKYTLFLRPAGYTRTLVLPRDRKAVGDDEGRLRIPLDPAASVEGRIVLNGTPLSGLRVTIHPRDNKAWQILKSPPETRTDSEGRFRFDALPTSEYNMIVKRSSGSRSWLSLNFALSASEQKVLDFASLLGPNSLRGRVLDGHTPVPNAGVSLAARFNSPINLFQTDTAADGSFEIPGLPEGTYRANPTLSTDDGHYSAGADETVRIQGDTVRDFQLARPHIVSGSLEFPKDLGNAERNKFTGVHIERKAGSLLERIKRPKGAPDQNGQAEINEGHFRIQGRFQGEYVLRVFYNDGGGKVSSLRIDPPLHLDNLSADQDVAKFAVPVTGEVRVRAALDPSTEGKTIDFGVVVSRPGEKMPVATFGLKIGEGFQTLSLIAPGRYELMFVAPGYQAEPAKAAVEVGFDSAPEVSVTLRPVGMIIGGVMDEADPGNILAIRAAALTAPDGRVITPRILDANTIPDMSAVLQSGDCIVLQSMFYFVNLERGTYTLDVEVDGFEPLHRTYDVVPGECEQANPIPMKRASP